MFFKDYKWFSLNCKKEKTFFNWLGVDNYVSNRLDLKSKYI